MIKNSFMLDQDALMHRAIIIRENSLHNWNLCKGADFYRDRIGFLVELFNLFLFTSV